ncbi:head completion/stabilization protein [Acidovorax sp. ACV02]|uniref:head completion/stabilization protein n=1 Tax=Acidovorax sp. ACV02 TaxID=2769310 RepID=UPI00178449B5|nr:head completion/stabilization protein [Acidovorax sp. ACV02]MBD9407243.1 head completion/stabilization protein [Acidovorax sp. ACV02]
MSFIATANPPIEADDAQVENDPWFPAIDAPKVREACLLDGTVTAARLAEAIAGAIDAVNAELRTYKADQLAQGVESLADAGDGRQAGRYLRAIHAHVQADLAEAYREIDTTPHNDSKTERIRERIEAKVDEHRRKLRWAISDLLGRPRTTVELI